MNDAYVVGERQKKVNDFVGAAHYSLELIEASLIDDPSLVNESATWNETAIEAAAQMCRRDIMEYLIANGAPVDICTAAALGETEKVRAMLDQNPELAKATGAHGLPLLYFPAACGYPKIAELLLSRGAEIDAGAGGNRPLHGAAQFGQNSMIIWLLDRGADLNADGYEGKTALEVAVENGHTDTAELLRARSR